MKFYITIIALISSSILFAQQGSNFSLWFLNNSQHNPAAVGAIDGELKAFANFRYQYFTVTSKPNRGISASAEGKIITSKTKQHYLGVGVNFFNDATGDTKYSVNELSIPIAYHINLNSENSLAIGISPGMYARGFNQSLYTWEHQWTGSGFDLSMPGDLLYNNRENIKTFDLGAGLFFKHQTSVTNKLYFGFSVKHLLGQDIGFTIPDKIKRRFTGQFGMSHRFENMNWGISPNVYVMSQGPNIDALFGTNVEFYLKDGSRSTIFVAPNSLSVGVYHRLFEGIIINAILQLESATIAIAYDSNINGMIRHSKSVGAVEISVAYNFIFNKRQKFLW